MKQSQLIIVGLLVAALAAGGWYWFTQQEDTQDPDSAQTTDETAETSEVARPNAVTYGQELRYRSTEGTSDATGGSAATDEWRDELGNRLTLIALPGGAFGYFGEMILVDSAGKPVDFFYNFGPGQDGLVLTTTVLGSGKRIFSTGPSEEDYVETPFAICSEDDIDSIREYAENESTQHDDQLFMEASVPYAERTPEEVFDPAKYGMKRGTIADTEMKSVSRRYLAMLEVLDENPDSCVNQRAELISAEEAQEIKASGGR